MALFSGTDILGVTPEQIGTPTGMLGDSVSLEPTLSEGWSTKPIRRLLQNCFSWQGCLTVPTFGWAMLKI